MSELQSINPYNQQVIHTFKQLTNKELDQRIDRSHAAFLSWRDVSIGRRSELMLVAAQVLRDNTETYAQDMTAEMGKTIKEARAEVEKCAWVCEYYAENAKDQLANTVIETDADESYVRYDPIGPVLAVMPWNYPFWQVFRFAAPNLMAGNVGLLKHASNVLKCSENIEQVFKLAGFPADVFQSLNVDHDQVETILNHPHVKAATLTGSEKAGKSIAATAGKNIKSTVLELGGSNAFVVLADADIEKAAKLAVQARFQNAGQSCIAAKRIIVESKVFDEFEAQFIKEVKHLKTGDPMEEGIDMGPMARKDLAESLNKLVKEAESAGADVVLGGGFDQAMHEPTVIIDVEADMAVMQEETFGPVVPLVKAKDREHTMKLAADTKFGLGISLITEDMTFVENVVANIKDGAVFVNELVKSDPRLPFGGTGISGYGRELSLEGIRAFVNKKTVYINHKLK